MPDEVKRWNLDIPDAGMLRDPDGEYVLAADYDRLRAERDALAGALAEIAKEEGGGYGFYLGGDPRKFCPDEESCTPEELAAHKEACEKWNEAEAKGEKMEPDPCGSGWISPTVHVTRSAYGLGSYTFPTDAARMAQAALASARNLPEDGVRDVAKKLLDEAVPIDPCNQWWFQVRDTHINALRTALGETP